MDRQPRGIRAALPGIDREARKILGARGEAAHLAKAGRRCWTGRPRSPNGSSAASSTSRKTASTGTWTARAGTRRRSSGRASRAKSARSPTSSFTARSANSPTSSSATKSRKGDRVIIYMPMIPEAADRHARLRAHRRGRIPWSSAGSARRASRTASTTARPSPSSPPMAATGAAAIVPLKKQRRRRPQGRPAAVEARHRLQRARTTTSTSRRAATSGGTTRWRTSTPMCPPAAARQRAPAFHPLHQRLDRQAEGHPAHHRRLPARRVHAPRKYVFDLREEDVYWCTADIGWVTGHSYVVYGPLANGATIFMYEGAPELPGAGPLVEAHRRVRRHHPLHRADRHPRVHQVGRRMARKARSLLPAPARHASASRSIPRPGCGIHEKIGGEPLPHRRYLVADGNRRRIMITPLPGAIPTKPGSATLPFFGVDAAVVDDAGQRGRPEPGRQARHPQAVALHAAHHLRRQGALQETVLERDPGLSISPATARGATRTAISGSSAASTTCSTSPGTASAPARSRAPSSRHPAVAEAAVVGRPDEIKGQGVVAFVTLKTGVKAQPGACARNCASTSATSSAPSPSPTKSASPMRCPRRAAARSCAASSRKSPAGKTVTGDTTTLEDLGVLAKLSAPEE